MKQYKVTLFCVSAFIAGVILSYSFLQYQSFQQRQAANQVTSAAMLENKYANDLLMLDDEVNKILVDCLNIKTCDHVQTAGRVATINVKRDAVIVSEQQNMGKIKELIH